MTDKNMCANYYSADPTKDVPCENCGKKLWDAQKQLKYWFPIFKSDYSGIRCVHCSHDYQNPWPRENLPDTQKIGSIDIPYFDKQAASCGMCPPTVFMRYEAALAKERPNARKDLDYDEQTQQAHEIYQRIQAEWEAEQVK